MSRTAISQKTLKVLFARSCNQCAYPDCAATIVDPNVDVVYGKVCHIEGVEPGSARHNPQRDAKTLNDIENLILLCERHHKLVDADPEKYTVSYLRQVKNSHEQKGFPEVAPFEAQCADLMIRHLETNITSIAHVYNGSTNYFANDNATQNIVINNIRTGGKRRSAASVPMTGTIGADASKRAYVSHLYDRLFDFTSAIPKYSRG